MRNIVVDFPIHYAEITELLHQASSEGRTFLFEHEVYTLLSQSGAETPPRSFFLPRTVRVAAEQLSLPGDKVVLKVVAPTIFHKTEVQGVRIIDNHVDRIRSAVRRMIYEIPENFAALIERDANAAPAEYRELAGEALTTAIRKDICGILMVEFMTPDSESFGNELIVSLRNSREFGMIITAGLGGTDTELYARRFRKGQAIVAASTQLNDGHSFFEIFKGTIAYRKLAGLSRGQRRIVTDEQLIECFESFICLGNYYSAANSEAPYWLDELEINPFAFTDYRMVPLDGLCRFSLPMQEPVARPIAKIDNLLHPKSIGIIGVSASRKNFGRIILDNSLAEGYPRDQMVIIHEKEEMISGVRCVPSIQQLPHKLDLFIVAVGSAAVPEIVDLILDLDVANSVMLIAGALGETEDSKQRGDAVEAAIERAHVKQTDSPIFLGANCMGVVSRPGGYDTWFIPEEKLPADRSGKYHRAVLISQSGAFMLHRSHQFPELRPAYMISMGNQTDLTLGDMLQFFQKVEHIDVIAVYAEGFQDLDGLGFCRAVREAVAAGKEVLFYKAGRTPEGKAATSGHTASVAGDYMVCESCVRQAGAMVARTFTEFQELFFLAETLNKKKIHGNRLGAISGAGFEAVGMADSIESDDYHMQLANYQADTRARIQNILETKNLSHLVSITNPLDINPAADDEAHAEIAAALLDDPTVDAVVISLDPLSPAMHTLADSSNSHYSMDDKDSIVKLITRLVGKSEKPLITVVDGGRLYDPLRDMLIKHGIPVFAVCDRAVAVLSIYIQGRLARDAIVAAR
ncbi:MAG: acetate--CoA ligase family protein [Desulforhopalus sp.]